MHNGHGTWPFQGPDENMTLAQKFRAFSQEMLERRQWVEKDFAGLKIGERLGRLVRVSRLKRGWSRDDLASVTKLSPVFLSLLEEGMVLPNECTPEVFAVLGQAFAIPHEALEFMAAVAPLKSADDSSWVTKLGEMFHRPSGFVAALWGFKPVSLALLGGLSTSNSELSRWEIEGPGGMTVSVMVDGSRGIIVELRDQQGGAANGWQVSLVNGTSVLERRPAEEGVAIFREVRELERAGSFIVVER